MFGYQTFVVFASHLYILYILYIDIYTVYRYIHILCIYIHIYIYNLYIYVYMHNINGDRKKPCHPASRLVKDLL